MENESNDTNEETGLSIDMKKIDELKKQLEEVCQKLAKQLTEAVEQLVTIFEESGMMELGQAKLAIETIRSNPDMSLCTRGYARAAQIGADSIQVRTTGPRRYSFSVDLRGGDGVL